MRRARARGFRSDLFSSAEWAGDGAALAVCFRHFLPFARGAEMVQGVVACDGEQPVDQRPVAIEPVETLVGLEEGLLR